MFKGMKFALLSMVALAASTLGAAADGVTVPAGKRSLIGSFALYDTEQCAASGVPEAKVVQQPKHGRIDFAMEPRLIPGGAGCKAFRMNARAVYYTPKPGFRGQDEVTIDYFFNMFIDAPSGTNRRQSITITVK